MTLMKLLASKEPTAQVKIGTIDGTSYFYCGTAGEFLANVSEFDKKFQAETESVAVTVKNAFVSAIADGFSWKGNLNLKDDNSSTLNEWTSEKISEAGSEIAKAYGKWKEMIDGKKAAAIESDRLAREKQSVLKRKVVDEFMADPMVEPISTDCILIYGWERGTLWMMSECQTKAKAGIK